jgi:hypothetical protein
LKPRNSEFAVASKQQSKPPNSDFAVAAAVVQTSMVLLLPIYTFQSQPPTENSIAAKNKNSCSSSAVVVQILGRMFVVFLIVHAQEFLCLQVLVPMVVRMMCCGGDLCGMMVWCA